jgi:hypothetical protein
MADDECGAVSGIIGRGNRSTRRKPAPVPLYFTQVTEVVSRRLTA